MALTPVAYTKAWKDTFGSQYAASDLALAIEPVAVVVLDGTPPAVSLNVSHASGVEIDWGDGYEDQSFGGIVNHTYTRNGHYRVRCSASGYPDVYTDTVFAVSDL